MTIQTTQFVNVSPGHVPLNLPSRSSTSLFLMPLLSITYLDHEAMNQTAAPNSKVRIFQGDPGDLQVLSSFFSSGHPGSSGPSLSSADCLPRLHEPDGQHSRTCGPARRSQGWVAHKLALSHASTGWTACEKTHPSPANNAACGVPTWQVGKTHHSESSIVSF